MVKRSPEPLVPEASERADSVASLSTAGVDSVEYKRCLSAAAAAADSAATAASYAKGTTREESEHEIPPIIAENIEHHHVSRPPSVTTVSLTSYESFGNHSYHGSENTEVKDPMNKIEVGDHIYKWCSFVGIPYAYQHHAIVMDVLETDLETGKALRLHVADFGNWGPETNSKNSSTVPSSSILPVSPTSSSRSGDGKTPYKGCIRTYDADIKGWKKVRYEAGFWKRTFSWSGTTTSTMSDPPALVRARAEFLVKNPHVIPPYDIIFSNCECVALWCKTGTWTTLQAASWLSTSAAGQVKSAVTMAGTVAAIQVPVVTTVPAAGIWGWLGYTTQTTVQVSLASTQPLLLPAIATFGVVTVGIPAVSLALAHRHWRKMTKKLNKEFWESAVAEPDIFVECFTHWSTHLGS